MTARRPERFWGGLLALALAIPLTLFLSWRSIDDQDIQSNGIQTSGIIMAREYIGGRNSRYKITYQYQPSGNAVAVTATVDISKGDWEQLQIGDSVKLRYRAERPQAHVLPQPASYDATPVWLLVLIMWAWALIDLSESQSGLAQRNPNTVSQTSIDYFVRNQRR